jgi:membrane-associated phospholipid phosphatase
MKITIGLIIALMLFQSADSFCQSTDSLINKLDSTKKNRDTVKQVNLIEPAFYDERTKMNGKVFGVLLLDDFKQQALSPLDIHGRGWQVGAALVATAVGISFLDRPIQRAFYDFRDKNPGIEGVSSTISNVGGIYEGATFAAIATAGFVFKSPKLRTTTALATQSYLTSLAWSTLFKNLSGRERPDAEVNSPKFNGPFYTKNSSFPSQHATLAFAAARVYAMEYKNIPIIPVIAYTAASLITISRLTENKHWASDLFVGAFLGYACGTQVVNNYHRYAKLVRTGQIKKKKKGDTSFNIQYQPGVGLIPGVVYAFR